MCFVRYNFNSKAYKFIEESIRKLIIISDVVFNEVMKKGSLMRRIVRTPKVGYKLVNLEHEDEEKMKIEESTSHNVTSFLTATMM
jgi:hypothetical protein